MDPLYDGFGRLVTIRPSAEPNKTDYVVDNGDIVVTVPNTMSQEAAMVILNMNAPD